MRGHDEKAVGLLRQVQGDEGGAVSHGVIFTGRAQLPVLFLIEALEAGLVERAANVVCGVVRGGACVDKIQ